MRRPRVAVLIPARHDSTRFPGKPLVPLRGASGTVKSLIQRSWEAASAVPGVSSVAVVTDHPTIADTASGFGADVVMTSSSCRNGTERCAEAIEFLDEMPDIVVNLQGDAPLTPPQFITGLVEVLGNVEGKAVATPSLQVSVDHLRALREEEAAGRVGGTTVVTDLTGRALYFSKRLIPHVPEGALEGDMSPVRLHIGVYAYTPAALRAYVAASPGPLEELEGLEQLRFLECGIPIHVVEVMPPPWQMWELNNPSDVEHIEQGLARMGAE